MQEELSNIEVNDGAYQVYVHCIERGQLLQALWTHMQSKQNEELLTYREQIDRLYEMHATARSEYETELSEVNEKWQRRLEGDTNQLHHDYEIR